VPQVTCYVVPGLGLDHRSWPVPAGRVLTLPGYGVPARRGDDLAPAVLSARVVATIRSAGEPVLLAGHSAGCQVAAHAAATAPDLVRGLVLVGPTLAPPLLPRARLVAAWLRTARHEDPGQVPALARMYLATRPVSLARGIAAARADRIEPPLAAYPGPVLLLRGRHDAICTAEWLGDLADVARRPKVVTLPRGGHMVPLTHGALVADALTTGHLCTDTPVTRLKN
jgi:pimeloyl-ACP methyl ester carboxylesterase